MGKNSKSNEKHTWIALVAIALFPFPLFFTPKNPQNPPNLRVSSSMPLFQTILSCVPPLCVFQVPLFYASLPDDPLMRAPPMCVSSPSLLCLSSRRSSHACPPYACFQSLSSMPLFQTILSCVPLLCVFRVPLFYASLPVPKKKSLYSYQPLKLNLLKRIHFPFFYFPSFFKNQDAPLFSCRIFSFHMYAATLIPFSSQNISLTFLSAHTLVRVE